MDSCVPHTSWPPGPRPGLHTSVPPTPIFHPGQYSGAYPGGGPQLCHCGATSGKCRNLSESHVLRVGVRTLMTGQHLYCPGTGDMAPLASRGPTFFLMEMYRAFAKCSALRALHWCLSLQILKSLPPGSQNVTLYGHRTLAGNQTKNESLEQAPVQHEQGPGTEGS